MTDELKEQLANLSEEEISRWNQEVEDEMLSGECEPEDLVFDFAPRISRRLVAIAPERLERYEKLEAAIRWMRGIFVDEKMERWLKHRSSDPLTEPCDRAHADLILKVLEGD